MLVAALEASEEDQRRLAKMDGVRFQCTSSLLALFGRDTWRLKPGPYRRNRGGGRCPGEPAAGFRAARQIDMALWADPDRPLEGRVLEIGAQADAASRTFAVTVTVAAPALANSALPGARTDRPPRMLALPAIPAHRRISRQ